MRVTGVLLVAEHVSKGPKLAFRYPACATTTTASSSSSSTLTSSSSTSSSANSNLLSAELLAKFLTPKAGLRDNVLELGVGGSILIRWVTNYFCLERYMTEYSTIIKSNLLIEYIFYCSCPITIETVRERLGLRMFNVAFVVSSTDALRRHRPLLRTVTENAARMLSYEERRCGYVSREVTAVRIRNIFLWSFIRN